MRDAPADTYPSAMAEMAENEAKIRRVVAELLASERRAEPAAWWRAGNAAALGSGPGQGGVTPLRKSCGTERP
jgi:hypothetical protein